MFSQHILTSPEVQEEEQSILRHILEMPIETNKEQFECLGSIGNYHLTPYPDSNSNVPKMIDPKSHIGYNRHILHNPYAMSQTKIQLHQGIGLCTTYALMRVQYQKHWSGAT